MAHKILVIDDDLDVLRMLKKSLSAQLFEVDTATGVEETEELISQNAYSVAIVDLGLSHPDYTGGLDIVKSIRERYPRTKILVYTANANPQVKAIALKNGADLFLVKPVLLDKLSSFVMGLCAGIPGTAGSGTKGNRYS